MRHRVSGKHLGRSPSHRRALRRNLAVSLFEHGAIRTTQPKARDLRRFVEKLITAAKEGTLQARRRVIAALGDRRMFDNDGEQLDQSIVQKLFDEIAPRYADRPGGYTRIIRLSDRRIGDAGRQVLLQLVEETAAQREEGQASGSRRSRRAATRIEAAGRATEAPQAEEVPGPAPGEEPSEQVRTEDAPESGEQPRGQTE